MKKILILAIALFSSTTFASGYLVNLGQGIEIYKVHAHSQGGLTLWVNPNDIMNPDSCAGKDKVHIPKNLAGYDAMVTVIMTAYTTKKKVGLWSTGCSIIPFWGGTTNFPIVSDIWITE